jgi:hypothetical protein
MPLISTSFAAFRLTADVLGKERKSGTKAKRERKSWHN